VEPKTLINPPLKKVEPKILINPPLKKVEPKILINPPFNKRWRQSIENLRSIY